MTQRYADPRELERMANGLCPECGNRPEAHTDDNRFWLPSVCGVGGLMRSGVVERIAQYMADIQGEQE